MISKGGSPRGKKPADMQHKGKAVKVKQRSDEEEERWIRGTEVKDKEQAQTMKGRGGNVLTGSTRLMQTKMEGEP